MVVDYYTMFLSMRNNQNHCYLCEEAFMESNPPNINCINNELGNELSSWKLAYASYNILSKHDDDQITHLLLNAFQQQKPQEQNINYTHKLSTEDKALCIMTI